MVSKHILQFALRILRYSLAALAALSLSPLIQAAPPASMPVALEGAESALGAEPRLLEAARQGDRDAVRALLRDGADVNAVQADGMTALHWAALEENVDLARMLLYAGANVRATTRLGGYTPLLMASKNGNAPLIEALIDGGADPNTATANGTTPLMLAAASGKADAVSTLLEHGADVNAAEAAKSETALMFAAAYGRADAIRALTDWGADVSTTSRVADLSVYTREEQQRFAAFAATGAPPGSGIRGAAGSGEAGAQASSPQKNEGEGRRQQGGGGGRGRGRADGIPGVERQYLYNELVGTQGGLTPLAIAARQGHLDAVKALFDAGADPNQPTAGEKVTPLLVATINGQFDVATYLLERGADPNLAAANNNATPLYAALNCQWSPRSGYPQPRAYEQQRTTHLELMRALLEKGADPNVRLTKKTWYSGYNFDLSGVDEAGATPFWRAAYAADVDAMKLLIAYGADPNIWTERTPGRVRTGDAFRETKDVSGLPPVPVGAPAVPPLLAAAGVGYGEGFAANSHHFAPGGQLAAVKYLVEALHADVNATDHEGNTALHHAAARGDNEMILYLVSKGADVKAVSREGRTTADMANGPVQRIQPFPETIALLEKLGAKNNHRCVSC